MNIAKVIKSYSLITIGITISMLGWAGFLIPNKIAGGGVGGLSTIFYYLFHISPGLTYFSLNVVLIILGLIFIGKDFSVKTIYSVILGSVLLQVFVEIFPKGIFTQDPFLATIIGSVLIGTGIAIVFLQNGTTGGSDIIAQLFNRYFGFAPGRVIMITDALVIIFAGFAFWSTTLAIYGFIAVAIYSYTIDFVMQGESSSREINVYSDKNEQIAKKVMEGLRRGATFIDAKGGFTGNTSTMLLMIVRRKELPKALNIIRSIDPDAFISVKNVSAVYGKGFARFPKIKPKS